MLKKIIHHKWHINQRVFIMLLLLLVVVFTSVYLAFNIFVQSYITANVTDQLNDIVNNFGTQGNKPGGNKPKNEGNLPDMARQPKNRIGIQAEVFMLDGNYSIKDFNTGRIGEDSSEIAEIAGYLKSKNISLTDSRNIEVNTESGEYYISTMEDMMEPNSFIVFYVNVTGTNALVNAVYIALGLMVTAAMLICLLIANIIARTVTKPIKKLSAFAEDIGKGNFKRREFSFRDIEFDELGDAMNQSAEKLDLYDKDQQAFFQNVSHELRTPLQSIRCYAEGVEYGLMDPKASGATIVAETDRLSDLVEDLLYISRVDTINNSLVKHENDLRDTLALCAESLKPLADKNGIHIEYRFDDALVTFAYNEKHMYRAFSNLISNALRYAKSTVILRCTQDDSSISISVIDDGEGISEKDMPFIFERFYKGKGGKHGIGLSIVKSVSELHGGEVSVNCDSGTCFTIRFQKENS